MYDALAPRYDDMHRRFLRHAGGQAQAVLEACLMTRLAPGMRVLDAGCGTGALARRVSRAFGDSVALTLLDTSREMLARTRDIRADRVQGSLLNLPFQTGGFDLGVACWSIEATDDELVAVAELMRVVRPGGHVLVVFCADQPTDTLAASLLRKSVEFRGTGRFLDTRAITQAFHTNGAQSVLRHRCKGPAAVLDATRAAAAAMRAA